MSTVFDRFVQTSSHGGGIARTIASPAGTTARTMAPSRKSTMEQAPPMMTPSRHPKSPQSRGTGFE